MVSGASLLAEVVLRVISGVFEICLCILIGSLKPWRYLLSRSFRARVNAQYTLSHPVLKWCSLVWETALLLASVMIVATIVWFASAAPPNGGAETSEHRRTLHEIERAIFRKAIEDRSISK